MAQKFRLARRGVSRAAQLFGLGAQSFQRSPPRADFACKRFVPAEGVEQPAMRGAVEQPAIVGLAVNLDEPVAEIAQEGNADRFIVQESAGASVAGQCAA